MASSIATVAGYAMIAAAVLGLILSATPGPIVDRHQRAVFRLGVAATVIATICIVAVIAS